MAARNVDNDSSANTELSMFVAYASCYIYRTPTTVRVRARNTHMRRQSINGHILFSVYSFARSLCLGLHRSSETLAAVDDIPMNLKIVEQFCRFLFSVSLCRQLTLPDPTRALASSTHSLSLLGGAVTAPSTGWISFVIAIYALRARTMLTVIIFTTERILLGLRKLPNVSMTHCSISNEYKYEEDRDGERNQHHSLFSIRYFLSRAHFYDQFFFASSSFRCCFFLESYRLILYFPLVG